MTCEDFRALTTTKDIAEATSAERAAAAYHWYHCIECKALTGSSDERDRTDIDAIVAKDRQDAEVQSIMKPIWDNCKGCGE